MYGRYWTAASELGEVFQRRVHSHARCARQYQNDCKFWILQSLEKIMNSRGWKGFQIYTACCLCCCGLPQLVRRQWYLAVRQQSNSGWLLKPWFQSLRRKHCLQDARINWKSSASHPNSLHHESKDDMISSLGVST